MRLAQVWVIGAAAVVALTACTDGDSDSESSSLEDRFPGPVIEHASPLVTEPLWNLRDGWSTSRGVFHDDAVVLTFGEDGDEGVVVADAGTGDERWSITHEDPMPGLAEATLARQTSAVDPVPIVTFDNGEWAVLVKYEIFGEVEETGLAALSGETGEALWTAPVITGDPTAPVQEGGLPRFDVFHADGDTVVAVVQTDPMASDGANQEFGYSQLEPGRLRPASPEAFDGLRTVAIDGASGETLWEDTGMWPIEFAGDHLLSYQLAPKLDDGSPGQFLISVDPATGQTRRIESDGIGRAELLAAAGNVVVVRDHVLSDSPAPDQVAVIDVEAGESIAELDGIGMHDADRCATDDRTLIACVFLWRDDADDSSTNVQRMWTFDLDDRSISLASGPIEDGDGDGATSPTKPLFIWHDRIVATGSDDDALPSVVFDRAGRYVDVLPGRVVAASDEHLLIDDSVWHIAAR